MNKSQAMGMTGAVPARVGRAGGWQSWAPYAAVAWSLAYAVLGIYWAVSGRGFPFEPENMSGVMRPVVGQFGLIVSWVVVLLAGIPAAAMGAAMLRGTRKLRGLLVAAGALLALVLLLGMADLLLLETLGYVPYAIVGLVTGAKVGQIWMATLAQAKWTLAHQLLCIAGGFVWLAATVRYARLSSDACLACGRREGPEGWQAPERAARWGRTALYVGMAVPVLYALTRIAWVLGIPLGMSQEAWQSGQDRGMWVAGLFLALFGLAGAALMLGLVQRWGEVFPRWMVGLAGRRVPIALAVVPAALVSVLLVVGGMAIASDLGMMIEAVKAQGVTGAEVAYRVIVEVGPTLLFPLWGIALAVATLGYYLRRRGACSVCGRGASAGG